MDFASPADGPANLTFATSRPVAALHFKSDLGPWRSEDWHPSDPRFRWVKEADGERLERSDGAPFSRVTIALALRAQGMADYAEERLRNAEKDCGAALRKGPLTTATARGDFDAHYACGLVAAMAVDRELHTRGKGLDDFNRSWFAAIASGADAGPPTWLRSALGSGVSGPTLALVRALTGDDASEAGQALDRLTPVPGVAVAETGKM